MQSRNAFTLVEMLAVIGIMLILMTVSFGMFRLFAERTGPEAGLARIQAVINGARAYAATSGRYTRVTFKFRGTGNKVMEGSTLTVEECYEVGNTWDWRAVPGSSPLAFHDRVYVCQGLPQGGAAAPGAVANRSNPNPSEIVRWREYEQAVLEDVEDHALSGDKLDTKHDGFCIEFCPAGFPPAKPRTTDMPVIDGGLTLVKVARGRVTTYAFYMINTNTGTRLIFE